MTQAQNYYAGKVALVTGAASGIGYGLSEAMAKLGAEVVMTDIDEKSLQLAVNKLQKQKLQVHGMQLDVTNEQQFHETARAVIDRLQKIDILLNNAGIGIIGCVCDHESSDWQRLIDVNIKGVIHGIQAVYPYMLDRKQGSIINVASLAGLIPVPGSASYAMTKHAVVGLSQSMRAEAAHVGINVTALCPSFIETNIVKVSKLLNLPKIISERVVKASGGAISLDDFVAEAIAGIAKEKALLVLPRKARVMWLVQRLVPGYVQNNALKMASRLFTSRLNPQWIRYEAPVVKYAQKDS
ncbi:MAG: SDR family NAD(P)-dependent oxidoreductase [Oligoflexus sp.]